MKKLKYLALVALLVPVMVVLTACGGGVQSDLVGEWTRVSGTGTGHGTTLELNKDGTFEWGDLEGTWTATRTDRTTAEGAVSATGNITFNPEEGESMTFRWLFISLPAIEEVTPGGATLTFVATDAPQTNPTILHSFTLNVEDDDA